VQRDLRLGKLGQLGNLLGRRCLRNGRDDFRIAELRKLFERYPEPKSHLQRELRVGKLGRLVDLQRLDRLRSEFRGLR
jgi:hypothetical protein